MKRSLAEFFGTFCLVFAGTGAIVINDVSGGAVTHVGVALTFGLVVMVMIYVLSEVSGAHFNPAVTFGFWIAQRLPSTEIPRYLFSQCLGALSASLLLSLIFPGHPALGATFPQGTVLSSFILEFVMTLLLMFVILSVSTGSKEKGITAGIAIGGTVALEALFGGPISGASMNPARSLGPAVISARIDFLWIYLTAPFLGSLVSVGLCRFVQAEGCCGRLEKKSCR